LHKADDLPVMMALPTVASLAILLKNSMSELW